MSPYSLIISDLHLSSANQDAYRLFCQFLMQHQGRAEKLFILGDFFEFWIGDDDPNPFYQSIINQLKQCAEAGTALFFMRGNRDFLIGRKFCQASHMALLKDPTIVELHGHSILLTHGDLLCSQDKRYQRYRRFISQSWLQWLFLKLPLAWRLHIAQKVREDSIKQNQKNRIHPQISDVDSQTVEQWMSRNNIATLIHGHTHRFAQHQHNEKTRWVLSDWQKKGSYLLIERNKIHLKWYTGDN